MTKGPYNIATKNTRHSKNKKGKKRAPVTDRSSYLSPKPASLPETVLPTSEQLVPRMPQRSPEQPYILKDLKTSAVIAGALLLVIVILALVL